MDESESSPPYGRHRQVDVYTSGMLADRRPEFPVAYEELRDAAEAAMSEKAYAYVAGAAGGESTKRENRRAFDDWRLRPRMLRDVASRDLSVEVCGQEWSIPLALAPIGVQSLFHEDGELKTARAATDLEVPLAHSTAASETLEDVSDALDEGSAPKLFQLYWSHDDAITDSLLDRAERAGYDAVVVTLDTPLLGWRERDISLGYLPFLDGEGVADYFADPAFRETLDQPPEENEATAVMEFVDAFGDPGNTWADLERVVERTDLPVIPKGILHPEDARLAVAAGADGVVVSNHGGRQVDGSRAALGALPEVADAVGDEVDVLFDSGIRRGADVAKALALGADACLLGRPYCYGLALGGAEGVRHVVENVRADLDLTLALCGYDDAAAIDREAVVPADRGYGSAAEER